MDHVLCGAKVERLDVKQRPSITRLHDDLLTQILVRQTKYDMYF